MDGASGHSGNKSRNGGRNGGNQGATAKSAKKKTKAGKQANGPMVAYRKLPNEASAAALGFDPARAASIAHTEMSRTLAQAERLADLFHVGGSNVLRTYSRALAQGTLPTHAPLAKSGLVPSEGTYKALTDGTDASETYALLPLAPERAVFIFHKNALGQLRFGGMHASKKSLGSATHAFFNAGMSFLVIPESKGEALAPGTVNTVLIGEALTAAKLAEDFEIESTAPQHFDRTFALGDGKTVQGFVPTAAITGKTDLTPAVRDTALVGNGTRYLKVLDEVGLVADGETAIEVDLPINYVGKMTVTVSGRSVINVGHNPSGLNIFLVMVDPANFGTIEHHIGFITTNTANTTRHSWSKVESYNLFDLHDFSAGGPAIAQTGLVKLRLAPNGTADIEHLSLGVNLEDHDTVIDPYTMVLRHLGATSEFSFRAILTHNVSFVHTIDNEWEEPESRRNFVSPDDHVTFQNGMFTQNGLEFVTADDMGRVSGEKGARYAQAGFLKGLWNTVKDVASAVAPVAGKVLLGKIA